MIETLRGYFNLRQDFFLLNFKLLIQLYIDIDQRT